MECSREKEIIDVATIMRHGLALNKQMKDRSDNANATGLLKYFKIHNESEEKLKSIKTCKISDIFQSFKSKNGSTIVPKYILIEGAPGMGKTTLCKEIAYQWAEQHLLKDTELLFLIYLRDPAVANIKHLKDLVHYFYNFDEDATEQSKQCAKVLNSRDSNDVTIIFDGFDEFDSSSDSLITDILHRKVLPQCRIVVTSRLTASDRLHRIADVRVEVLGFSDKSKIQYIKQELKEHPDKVNKLQSYLNTHPSIQSICYMPMMMTILVYVFKEKGYLPTNSTELYNKLVALTISRQSKSDDLCVSIQTLPTECKSFLFNLSEFAFLTLQCKQKVFSKEDINNVCPNLTLTSSDLDSLVLINSVQYFCTDKGNTRVFNFLHLSIHEYLAAYYISSIDQCRQFNELENTFLNVMYQETWNMFIAMNKNKKTWLDFQNYSVYSKEIHYDNLSKWITDCKSLSFSECFVQLYNIIYTNSMSSDVVQIIFSKNDISAANAHQQQIYLSLWDAENPCRIELKLFIIDEAITSLNSNWYMLFQNLLINNRFSVVFYEDHYLSFIKATQKQIIDFFKYNNSITFIELKDCHVTRSSIDALQLSCLKCLLFFRTFSCSFEHSALIKLTNYLSSISTLLSIILKFLNIDNAQTMDVAGEALASVVTHNTGLIELHLSDNNLGRGMLIVTKALQQITSLRSIDLGNNNLSKEASVKLALAIQSNKHLEKLWLHNNNLKSSADAILQSLSTISTLKLLNINNTQTTHEAAEALASVVTHNTGLEKLDLSNNNLGEGMLVVTKALQQITSIKSLDLSNTNISKEASGEILLVVESNQHLENLGLSNNNLKSSAVAILQSLSTISTLKLLNINNTQTTHEAAEALASVVTHKTGLEELHLSGNYLGEGMLIVTKALQQITSLRSINLGNNNISKEASVELALAIQSNKHLEELRLDNNNLKSSAIAILQSLSTISTLTLLDIDNTQTTSEADEALASVVIHNTGLKELHLRGNNLGKGIPVVAKALRQITSLTSIDLGNNNIASIVSILQALHHNSLLKLLTIFNNTITEDAGNALAAVISRNIKLQKLSLNLLTEPLMVTKSLQNLSALQILVFDTCNISGEAEVNLASTITNNKSLTFLSLENIKLSQNIILQSIACVSNLRTLCLGDSSLSEEMSDDLSLAISSNKSLVELILLDNMLQTGLIKIAKACNELSNIKVLQLAHNCIVPSEVVELTSVITQNTSLERVLLGGITLNAAECFHLSINEVLHKTDISYNNDNASCVLFNHHTSLEMIYLEMLRKQICNDKKIFNNISIYVNAKNFVFIHKLQHYFNQSDITQLKTHDAKQKLLQGDAKKIISFLYILEKVKVIDLEHSNIDEDASFELATALHSNNVLEELWLRGNKLNTAGALYILNSLKYHTTLQVLDLSYNNISSQSADGIAAVIDNNTLLNQLWLDGNDLHSTGTIKICKALKKIRTLSILSLCNNGITDDAAVELSAVITQNVLLEDLLLSNNQLHSTGIELIAESLNKLIKLRKLDLFNNNIGKEGASSLAVVVQNSTSLQDLFLSSNYLETNGALEICNALSHICSLHVLTLSNNNINDEVTSQLIEVLNNNHLYALLIGGNGLECCGLKIAQVIENDNM